MANALLVVEGQHDIAAISRVLVEIHGLTQIRLKSELNQEWALRLVPHSYPPDDDLLKRVPVPAFFKSDDVLVVVHSANSDSQLARELARILENLDNYEILSAIGVICDSDAKSPVKRYKDLLSKLKAELSGIGFAPPTTRPGCVDTVNNSLRFGIHIFPDNVDPGTIETVLLECAKVSHPDLLTSARTYVDEARPAYGGGWDVSGESKVIVGCIANVFRPGTANQVSIQRDNWICSDTLAKIPSVQKFNMFIKQLLDLS